MDYGKLVDGALLYAPRNYLTSDGKMIFNFNSSVALMSQYGFKPIYNSIPSDYDTSMYEIVFTDYTETSSSITRNYTTSLIIKSEEQLAEEDYKKALELLAGGLSDEQANLVPRIYPAFDPSSHAYVVGDRVCYEGVLYRVLQAHTSQSTWIPSAAVSLFGRVVNETLTGEIPDFVQPTGATDCYNTGDKVRYNGVVYQSKIDANVWSPDSYPAGWDQVS